MMKSKLRTQLLIWLPCIALFVLSIFLCVSFFLLLGILAVGLDWLLKRLLRRPSLFNPQFQEACAKGNLQLVQRILSENPFFLNLNQQDKFGASPLSEACENGHIDVVQLLLRQQRVDVNQPCQDGTTPFYLSCQRGHFSVVRKLTERANLRKARSGAYSPFYIACHHGHVEIVRLLVNDKRVDVNQCPKDGTSPFAVSCLRGHLALAELLANNERIEVNKKDNLGATAFYLACQQGNLPLVRMLAKIPRLDVNRARNNGATPLYIATAANHVKIVKAILATEREIDTKRVFGGSNLCALQLASLKGFAEIEDLIERYEAEPLRIRRFLQKEILDEIAADYFSLMVFHCDEFLSLADAPHPSGLPFTS